MKLELVETFLTVAECRSVSLAAQKLYLGQSTISHRLKLLEDELDGRLFNRQRGIKNLYLTPFGESFLPVAHRWLSLWRETQLLKNSRNYTILTIGSVDIINSYTFVPLYQQHRDLKPGIRLDIRTHHSSELYGLLENKTIDIGFAYGIKRFPDVTARPIYSEEMFLVCHVDSPYTDDISLDQLSPEKEIFIRWGSDFEIWHDRYWANQRPLMRVNTGSMLKHYLNKPGYWSIAPMTCIKLLQETQNLKWFRLKTPPPLFVCYQLTHRYPKPDSVEVINAFADEVSEFVQQQLSEIVTPGKKP
ncbi:LysR family transcriptional regulator [Erwinia sp. S43]|uniref:LysR family transcriptional regulator n=1 Tax=unclassified Erwinia TaxID=2622719 RepID=UPI00190DD919|nr:MULTISPECIES: LysR family transcriptional regulator [unclassified Erwinia]MBK0034491.1 LysR family transcriptional regulator [Erwinia sp. S43]MCW1877372.1 LysR family transcriptional regulator [Erwinia sp. INIA01]